MRDEAIMPRLRSGPAGLNGRQFKRGKHNTGRCDHCGQEERCEKHEAERKPAIQNLRKTEVHFDRIDILQKNSGNESLLSFLALIRFEGFFS